MQTGYGIVAFYNFITKGSKQLNMFPQARYSNDFQYILIEMLKKMFAYEKIQIYYNYSNSYCIKKQHYLKTEPQV